MEFKTGQKVTYKGKETLIEELNKDEARIANPDWDWDDEAQFVHDGLEYPFEYWIWVNLSELTHIF
jgi:hypothetical protein